MSTPPAEAGAGVVVTVGGTDAGGDGTDAVGDGVGDGWAWALEWLTLGTMSQ
jgi:hypothetical protein